MGIDFDINSAPPDPATITAAYTELAAERLRLRGLNKRYLIVIATILTTILSFIIFVGVPIVRKPETDGGIVFVIVYAAPYMIMSVFVVSNTRHHSQVEKPRKILEAAEEALEEGTQDDIDALLDTCRLHPPLGAYQRQVESQGRALFKGELEAMRRWLEASKADSRPL
jgi:hypothetical protein